MKAQTNSTNRLVVAMLVVVALAAAFWILLYSPKREEADRLQVKVEQVEASLRQHEAEVAEAEAARKEFPQDYQRLVVLGKAVPGDDDVASLLIQLNRIAASSGGEFREFELTAGGEAGSAPAAAAEEGGEAPVSATEVAASLLPLGATIGPAGLAVMPYTVSFDGNFFEIADFIEGLDSMVKKNGEAVNVDGRLVTINGFSLKEHPDEPFPALKATFSLTTYLTPPDVGVTAGATPGAPAPVAATPASTTTGGAP